MWFRINGIFHSQHKHIFKNYHRFYATISSEGHDKELLKLLHSYPTRHNPSPYEVLDISPDASLANGQLKRKFFGLAKIYHPDSVGAEGYPLTKSTFFDINSESSKLTKEIKDERFKKVLAAYNLLRNPISKRNYDQYHVGWEDGINLKTNPNMYDPQKATYDEFVRRSRRANTSGFTSYETGTWEDKYRAGHGSAYGFANDGAWTAEPSGDFKEEFKKNRKTILLSTILFIGVYFAIQMTHLYLYDDFVGGKYNESLYASATMHEKSERDLFDAYTNYGFGESKDDRINRFLWWRKFTTLLSLGDVTEILDHLHARGAINHNEDGHRLKAYDNVETVVENNN